MTIKAKDYLAKHEIRPSVQRIAIMDYLLTHATHPTAEMIYNTLYAEIPTLSRTTVYNTLKLLVEHKAILSLDLEEQNMHYDGDTSAHAHFICRTCGMIYDLPRVEFKVIYGEHTPSIEIDETRVYYKGYCEKCKPNLT